MLDRLVSAYLRFDQRAEGFVRDLGSLVGVVITVVTFRTFTRPLRCQHCARAIQLATHMHPALRRSASGNLYRDTAGRYACADADGVLHKPMPSI